MEEFARFIMDGIDNFVDALLRIAFWKLGAGLVFGSLLMFLVAGLPEDYRSSARSVVLLALGLTALVTAFAPIDWRDILR